MSDQEPRPYDTVLVQPSSLDDVLSDHEEHLKWLREEWGKEAENFYRARFQNILDGAQVGKTVLIPMKQIGNIRVSSFTYSCTNPPKPSDPINLIFTSHAKYEYVNDFLENKIFPPWLDTGAACASPQYVRVENPANTGNPQWVKMSASKAIGGCALIRSHIRVFDVGSDSSTQEIGDCCIANVHYEVWEIQKFNHVIQDWIRPRKFVEKLFADLLAPATTSSLVMQQPENIQNVPNDGIASVIPLT